jgi:Winged helix DNA-binding domain
VTVKLSRSQVNSWRMKKHHLTVRAPKRNLANVVSDVCGIQAQVLSAAELAIRARVEGLSEQDVRDALWKHHTIVKTWCMRGTLHLLASRDLPTYVAALRTKVAQFEAWIQKTQKVTTSEVERITDEIKNVLAKETLNREELAERVTRRARFRPEVSRLLTSGWGILLQPAAYQGALAFGPSTGPKVTFIGPNRRIFPRKELPTEQAFAELYGRFLGSYGPATVKDFAHWWGNLPDRQASLLREAPTDFEEVEVQGNKALMLTSDAEEASGMGATHLVRLLPSFDCYAMFYSPREAFVPAEHRSRVFRQTAGWNYPTLMIDGSAAGIWNLKRLGRRAEVELELFRELNPTEKQRIQEEARDIGAFLNTPTTVKVQTG